MLHYYPSDFYYVTDVATIPGSAEPLLDYTEVNTTFTYLDSTTNCDNGGANCHTLSIPITDDFIGEDYEYFTVALYNAFGVEISSLSLSPCRIDIQDDGKG